MSHFALLRDPGQYAGQNEDLVADAEARSYWLERFAGQMDRLAELSVELRGRSAAPALAKARSAYRQELAALADGSKTTPLRLRELSLLRERVLGANRLVDPLAPVKQRWNAEALPQYLPRLDELDALAGPQRWLSLISGVLAGSLAGFETATEAEHFLPLEAVPQRPWLLDDYDRLAEALPLNNMSAWSKVVLFVDNAGAEFILGVMPLARYLALDGVRVILAANEAPALCSVTTDEAIEMVEQLAGLDPDLRDLVSADMFEVVSTGSRLEMLDLTAVSGELNAAAEGAELVILVGMNRGVVGNLAARFTCDSLRLCLLTDAAVARNLGGGDGDAVCRFTPAPD